MSKMSCGDSPGDEHQWIIQNMNRTHSAFDNDAEKIWKGPYYFIQTADIQFGLIDRYILKLTNPSWEKEIELAEKAVEKINSMTPKPKFVVMCGDLCDAMPDGDPDVYKRQIATFKRIFSKLNPEIPMVCVCGNHDVGDHPTKETMKMFHSNWGDDYFSFWCGGILYISLNSQYYYDPSGVPEEAEAQEVWLDKVLSCVQPGRAVVFMHIPPFINSADETGMKYFSLTPEPRKKLLDKLLSAGIKNIFCGHLHRNAGGFYKDLEVVVTSAMGGQLGNDSSGFRVVNVKNDAIAHTYYELDNVPKEVTV